MSGNGQNVGIGQIVNPCHSPARFGGGWLSWERTGVGGGVEGVFLVIGGWGEFKRVFKLFSNERFNGDRLNSRGFWLDVLSGDGTLNTHRASRGRTKPWPSRSRRRQRPKSNPRASR